LESTRSLIDQDRGPRHLDQSLLAPQPGLGGRVTGYPHARQVAEACLSAKGTLPGHSEFQGARSSVSSWKAPCNPPPARTPRRAWGPRTPSLARPSPKRFMERP